MVSQDYCKAVPARFSITLVPGLEDFELLRSKD